MEDLTDVVKQKFKDGIEAGSKMTLSEMVDFFSNLSSNDILLNDMNEISKIITDNMTEEGLYKLLNVEKSVTSKLSDPKDHVSSLVDSMLYEVDIPKNDNISKLSDDAIPDLENPVEDIADGNRIGSDVKINMDKYDIYNDLQSDVQSKEIIINKMNLIEFELAEVKNTLLLIEQLVKSVKKNILSPRSLPHPLSHLK